MKSLNLLAPAFVSGACAMVIEIAGSRIIAPYLGTTIYTWAAVIGLVMAALSAGYFYGGKLADKYNDKKHLTNIFFLAALCTLLIPLLGKIIVPFMVLLPLGIASILSAIILVPASFFFGMVSPYVIKLISKEGNIGKSSGKVFSISTFGSIIGTLGTGFILVPNISITLIFIGAAFAMLISGWFLSRKMNRIDIAMFCVLAIPISFIGFAPSVDGDIIFQTNSEYFMITVIDNVTLEHQTGRILLLDDTFSSAETSDGSLIFKYPIKAREAYNISKNPKRALVVGVAAGTQIEDLKKTYPNIIVDGVEIDQKVVDVGYRYFSLKNDNRTNIIIDDGRRYVKTTDKKYDIVLLDVFRGISIPSHLTSIEFIEELKNVTNPDGVIIANIVTIFEGDENLFLQLIYNTFSEEFSNVLLLPLGKDPQDIQNVILIATDANVTNFIEEHSDEISAFKPTTKQIITDDRNPMDVLVQGN